MTVNWTPSPTNYYGRDVLLCSPRQTFPSPTEDKPVGQLISILYQLTYLESSGPLLNDILYTCTLVIVFATVLE